MLSRDQKQNASEGSTAIQAGGDVTITNSGLTYSDVRQIALDVFFANFYKLAGYAKETARERAEEITEAFLRRLQAENPEGLEKSNDPDFQYSLFNVQKEYARNGDKDLGGLLVDLLVDRSKQPQRDILQIVLNESIITAPKLTENQLAALAIIFLFKYTQTFSNANHKLLGDYFDKFVYTHVPKIVKNLACYQHLEFSGCGSIGLGERSLESIFSVTYPGLFQKGFDEKEIADKTISIGLDDRFFNPCLNDRSKIQIWFLNQKFLEEGLDKYEIAPEDRTKIIDLFNMNKMNDDEIRAKCIEIRPYMADLFEIWSDSAMKNFTLTSVGIAIGHANIKRLAGEFSDLSIWIN